MLNQKTYGDNVYIKKTHIYMLFTRELLQSQRHTWTEIEGMKKWYSMQMETKRNPGQQYLYQKKWTLKQRLKQETKKDVT